MQRLECDFDELDSLPSFWRLRRLADDEGCTHVANVPVQKRDEFVVVAYAKPACWFAENTAGKDCGLRGGRELRGVATHNPACARRIPDKIVISFTIVSDEPDRLTFGGGATASMPPIVLTPFSAKGRSGLHRVEHKRIEYESSVGPYLKYASTGWQVEIDRNGVRLPPRQVRVRVAIPPEGSAGPSSLSRGGVADERLLDCSDGELEVILRARLDELSKLGFLIGVDYREFARRQKKSKALEIQLIRYCFVEHGELLKKLYLCRQGKKMPSKEMSDRQWEVFSSRRVGERYNVSHNTVRVSQVYSYVRDQLLPELPSGGREVAADVDIAYEEAAVDSYRETVRGINDDEERRSLREWVLGSDRIDEEIRGALVKMLDEGWEASIVEQKIRDFLDD